MTKTKTDVTEKTGDEVTFLIIPKPSEKNLPRLARFGHLTHLLTLDLVTFRLIEKNNDVVNSLISPKIFRNFPHESLIIRMFFPYKNRQAQHINRTTC